MSHAPDRPPSLPLLSFGKSSIAVRLLAQTLFLLQAVLRGLFVRDLRCLLVSTSPPHAGAAGWLVSVLRRVPVKYWVMDLNPDQMVMMGKVGMWSLAARTFDVLSRLILRRASDVVVLDRYMAERVNRKADVANKLTVLPPWPHQAHLEDIPHNENPFRRERGLERKFVVMYSGNHSPANPLTTILEAARRLRDDARFAIVFVGGGQGKEEVDSAVADGGTNVLSPPTAIAAPRGVARRSRRARRLDRKRDGWDRPSLQDLWCHGRRADPGGV